MKREYLIFMFIFLFLNQKLSALDLSTKPFFTDKEKVIEYILYKSPKELEEFLPTYKYDINSVKLDGKLPIEYALTNECNYQKIKTLLKYKINLNLPFKNDYYYPLHYVAEGDNCGEYQLNIVNLFLKNKALVNQKNALGDTPLHFATKSLNLKLSEYLILNNADTKIYTKNYPLAHYLIKYITPKSEEERNNLYYILKLLIKYGYDIDKLHNDKTLLTLALQSKKNGIAKLLILHNAKVNIKTKNHFNIPLLAALLVDLHQDNLDIVKILIKFGANIKDVNKKVEHSSGNIPFLILSMMKKKYNTTAFLILNGADVNVKANGANALFYSLDNQDVYKLLKKFGAKE